MAKSHPRWRLAKKVLTWLFFIAVVVLLVVYAKKVDWGDVWTVIRDYNRTALLSAVAGDRKLSSVRLLRPAWTALLRP